VLREPAWRVHVVVVTELPRTRDTVLLRLLGPTRIRMEAIKDLMALPEGAWERAVVLPWLQRLRLEVPEDPAERTDEERDFIMETREWFEQYKARERQKSQVELLVDQYAWKLDRPLTEGEQKVLVQKIDRLGVQEVTGVLFRSSVEALAAWLADPAAR
jgi:hypothetical protein